MMRGSGGRLITTFVCLFLFTPAIGCVAQQLELIAPSPTATLQYKTDDFLVFFSPATGEEGIEGLHLSLTNTTDNTLSIDWQSSYFVLPDSERSDAITSDIPTSFQQTKTQVSIRQTVENVAIPLSSVSYSESGWSIGAIAAAEGSEFTLHLVLEYVADPATGAVVEAHDFTFRVVEAERGTTSDTAVKPPAWSALIALAVGFLLGFLLAAP